jgi:hypothetical protein
MGEHEQLSMYGTLKNIFKVIYAPHKAFKEIIQNPKYIGPILIMILFVLVYTGGAYVAQSKLYNEQTLPTASQGDEWTENITRALWRSNAKIAESDDSIGANKSTDALLVFNFYGNKSIEFSVDNDKQIWMQLNFTEPINCLDPEGYKKMSFWTELIYPNTTDLNNASLYLFSGQIDYCYYNLTRYFVPFNDTTWNKLTIAIGPGNEWVSSSTNTNWGNIISLKFEFMLTENSNITVRLDGLFFKGVFKPSLENGSFNYALSFSLFAGMQFVIQWVFLGGLIYIMSRAFGGKTLWRPLLILVGFALITMFVQALINAAVYSTLPTIYRPLEFFSVIENERLTPRNKFSEETWLVSLITGYTPIAVLIWTIALCAFATRLLAEFSWSKSFLVATVAYFVTTLAQSFLLGF